VAVALVAVGERLCVVTAPVGSVIDKVREATDSVAAKPGTSAKVILKVATDMRIP
jgi:hypothetical protein